MKISILDATAAQLRQFAMNNLGLDIHVRNNAETIRAKIATCYEGTEIELPDEDFEPPSVPVKAHPTEGDGKRNPRYFPGTHDEIPVREDGKVCVHIGVGQEKGGNDPVPAGVNGRVMLIPREKDVMIPVEYFLVLIEAVQLKYEMEDDGRSINPVPRQVPMYPIQLRPLPQAA